MTQPWSNRTISSTPTRNNNNTALPVGNQGPSPVPVGSSRSRVTEQFLSAAIDARSKLVELLSNDRFLKPIYREVIGNRSIGAEHFVHDFSRLLKTYSEALEIQARQSTELFAAKLVWISTKHIAKSIKKRYLPGDESTRGTEEGGDDSFGEEASTVFQQTIPSSLLPVKDFLMSSGPYHQLLEDVKLLARKYVPPKAVGTQKRVDAVGNFLLPLYDRVRWAACSYAYLLKGWMECAGLVETTLTSGMQRVRWKCCCGLELFDDYIAHEPAALEEIQRLLDGSCSVNGGSINPGQEGNPTPSGNRMFSTFTTSITGVFARGTPTRQLHLPTHNSPCIQNSEAGGRKNTRGDPMHLLMCLTTSRLETQLDQELVDGLACDRELFAFLNQTYFQRRGRMRSWFSLKTPVGVHFIEVSFHTPLAAQALLVLAHMQSIDEVSDAKQFSLIGSQYTDIHEHEKVCHASCRCLPPKKVVEDAEYKCNPIPPKRSPPIGPKAMAHYLMHPGHVKEQSCWILSQLPKKLNGKLEERANGEATGWGIYFKEGPNWNKIWAAMLLIFVLGSMLFGIMWSVFEKDVQGAFGVSGWWIALGSVFLGYWATRE
ncbi:hypothetical protein FQN52_000925 [Onygenales sp. PD_12]|nr:hypothetical protein FQN52_000925 [Onygenales sp. PD_12]